MLMKPTRPDYITEITHMTQLMRERTFNMSDVFSPFFHELIEVFFHVLEHEVEVVVLSDDFLQLHHVGVVQLLQRLITQKYLWNTLNFIETLKNYYKG